MRITEIFFSIQGESSHAGKPCGFVRLTGCSRRCVYCDTKYAYAGGRGLSRWEALSVGAGPPARVVEASGGAPAGRSAVNRLISCPPDRRYSFMLETGCPTTV